MEEEKYNKSEKRNKIIINTVIILFALLLVTGGVIAFAGKYITNQFKLMTMGDIEYYKWVEKNNADDVISTIAGTYSIAKKLSGNTWESFYTENTEEEEQKAADSAKRFMLKLELSDDFTSSLELPAMKPLEITIGNGTAGRYSVWQIQLFYDYMTLLTGSLLTDAEQDGSYIQIPEFRKEFIKLSTPSGTGDTVTSYVNDLAEIIEDFSSISLTKTELKNILERYSHAFIDRIVNVSLEKSQEISKEDKSIKCVISEITLSAKELQDILVDLLGEISTDKELIQVLLNNGLYNSSLEFQGSIASIRSLLRSISGAAIEGSSIVMKNYINNKGELIYRDILLSAEFGMIAEDTMLEFHIAFGDAFSMEYPTLSIKNREGELAKISAAFTNTEVVSVSSIPSEDTIINWEQLDYYFDSDYLYDFIGTWENILGKELYDALLQMIDIVDYFNTLKEIVGTLSK